MVIKDFDKEIAKELGMNKADVRKVIGSLEKVLLKKLVFSQEVVIRNVGKFIQSKREAKYMNNVNTGERQLVPKRYKIQFRTTPSLDNRMKAKKVY